MVQMLRVDFLESPQSKCLSDWEVSAEGWSLLDDCAVILSILQKGSHSHH